MSYFCQKPNPISFFFSWLKYKSQSTCSLILKPRYLTCAFRGIYWPLILKFRCFVMLLLDLGLNSKISVLLVFKDILFALSHVVRSFKSWLICLLIFFKELSASSKLVSSAKWCTLQNFVAWFLVNNIYQKEQWTENWTLWDPKLYQSIVRILTTHCYMLFSISKIGFID